MNGRDAPFLSRWGHKPTGAVAGETLYTEVKGETSDEAQGADPSTYITRVQGETSDDTGLTGPLISDSAQQGAAPYLARWAQDAVLGARGETSETRAAGETTDEAL